MYIRMYVVFNCTVVPVCLSFNSPQLDVLSFPLSFVCTYICALHVCVCMHAITCVQYLLSNL